MSRISYLGLFLLLFIITFSASLTTGQYAVSLSDSANALFNYDSESLEQVIVRTSRMPRAFIAALVGAAFAIAGVLMQALTRNPMASPAILGVNAGAIFCIVLATSIFAISSMNLIIWLGFAGAAIAAGIVLTLGSVGRGGMTPSKVVLAGAALSALFVSFTQALLIVNQEGLDRILFWLAGSVAGKTLSLITPVLPYLLLAMLISCLLGRQINILMSGDDIAKGLGQPTLYLKIGIAILVVCLAGGAVSIVGNIAFLGLVVPHIVRLLVTTDHRWLIPLSGLGGAIILLLSDVIARVVIMPQELPVGVITALIGTPLFIFLARRGLNNGH